MDSRVTSASKASTSEAPKAPGRLKFSYCFWTNSGSVWV